MHFVKAKSILTSSGGKGTNVYRGCTHGCIYCDSRSRCYHIDHQFEDIAVKQNATELLEDALQRKQQKCMIGSGSMCDPYMPIEEKLCITQSCLKIIEKYGFGATLLTKSNLVMRDLDLLAKINKKTKAVLQMTLTTYNENLCKLIEPNVCTTKERFDTLCSFRDNNIPTVVWISPILPFINDTMENLEGIMEYCIEAKVKGIINFGFGLTLREGNREYFYQQLDKNFPTIKQKYETTYGEQYQIISKNHNYLMKRFNELCEKNNILHTPNEVFAFLSEFQDKSDTTNLVQGELF